MPPQFVGIQDSGEHRTSGERAKGGVNPRCAAAGEAKASEGEKRSDGFWVAGHTQNSSPAERRGARYPTACPPRGGKHVTQQLAPRKAGSTLQSFLRSRRRVPGKVHPPDRDRKPRQPRQSSR